MQDTKRVWIWVGVAVIVIGGILAFLWRPGITAPMTTTNPTSTSTPTSSPQSQQPPQLPKQLLLDGMSAAQLSYSTTTSPGAQYTAVINASTAMPNLYYSYTQYFVHNGWGFTGVPTNSSSSKSLLAETTSSSMTITIVAKGKGSQVTITSVAK